MNPASATATLPGADDPRSAMATAANAPTPMSGACWLVQALAAEGVDTLFGYPGGATLPFYAALHGAGLRPTLVRSSAECRVGTERVRTCSYRWSPPPLKT